jgi:hypothetical protein
MSLKQNDNHEETRIEFWERMVAEGKIKPEELEYWIGKGQDAPSAEEEDNGIDHDDGNTKVPAM